MATSGVVVWEWQNDFGNWQPYSPQISTFIESQQSSSQPVSLGQVDPNFYCYTIDFSNMSQIRQGTGTQRAVRRTVYPLTSSIARCITWQWEADVPGKWNDFDVDISSYLEECQNKNVMIVDLMAKFSLPYQIDLRNMTQTRVNTGRTRKIQKVFTSTSYPSTSNLGQTGSSMQNGLKRKTVINKNASLKKSKSGSSGFIPPPSTMPINGFTAFQNVSAMQGGQQSAQGAFSLQSPVASQLSQGPLTRNKYSQAVSGFSAQTTTQNQSSIPNTLPGNGISSTSNFGSLPSGNQSMVGSWHAPTTLPFMPSSGSGFQGLQPPGFFSFLNPSTSHSGNQTFYFGSQPMSMSFNPSQFFSTSSRGRIRPSNPGATSTATGPPGPNLQQSPFQTASATVPSITPFPKHARIPNNVPKGGKGGSQSTGLCADDILHNYVTVVGAPPASEDCCICYEKLIEASGQGTGGPHDKTVLQLEKCSHMFHKLCLDALFNSGPKDGSLQCPSCKTIYGEKMGNCPRGEMEYMILNHSLEGYEDCKTLQILYHIHGGVQGPEHPHPGQRYSTRGFPRIGYLPDNEKGRKVLQLLIVAWKRRLTFTIGTSTTTGESDTVTWNEIHHKTEHTSNYSGHGYPDPKYLDNVLSELAVHGITEKDLPP